ncbi:hypothetical protein D3C75_910740 [compost metagenome]
MRFQGYRFKGAVYHVRNIFCRNAVSLNGIADIKLVHDREKDKDEDAYRNKEDGEIRKQHPFHVVVVSLHITPSFDVTSSSLYRQPGVHPPWLGRRSSGIPSHLRRRQH